MLGQHVKKIRQNKGYTQCYVCENLLSQSAYSKFESNQSDINSTAFINLMERFHMTMDDLLFIKNNYKFKIKEKLMLRFFSLPYNDEMKLQNLILELQEFLREEEDLLLEDIKKCCMALISLQENGNIDVARNLAEPVWVRLSKQDQWYLNDIRLLNTILFLFPIEVAIPLTQQVLIRLDLYNDFQDSLRLKTTIQINLSLLLIKSSRFLEALEILNSLLENYQQVLPYQSIAICFGRIAICQHKLINGLEEDFLQKAQQTLTIYKDSQLWNAIQEEYRNYCE